MNFANEMVQANLYAANVVECGTTKEHNVGKKVGLVLVSAAIALATGIGAAKICTDCLSECIAYADPIEETVTADEPAVGLLAETLKGMGSEA